jgi:hypothetical protein
MREMCRGVIMLRNPQALISVCSTDLWPFSGGRFDLSGEQPAEAGR